jgi:NAD(P)-dependent dehydrogenase (short-subunit alcohol dehydrogenase family)
MNSYKRIALVTGAGRPTGIGYETALQLARKGFHVILTERDRQTAKMRA